MPFWIPSPEQSESLDGRLTRFRQEPPEWNRSSPGNGGRKPRLPPNPKEPNAPWTCPKITSAKRRPTRQPKSDRSPRVARYLPYLRGEIGNTPRAPWDSALVDSSADRPRFGRSDSRWIGWTGGAIHEPYASCSLYPRYNPQISLSCIEAMYVHVPLLMSHFHGVGPVLHRIYVFHSKSISMSLANV